ncbi:MAG: hypothetical protein NVS4B11_02320 [Ktedonobacteraceae bacterium]
MNVGAIIHYALVPMVNGKEGVRNDGLYKTNSIFSSIANKETAHKFIAERDKREPIA